MAQLDTQKIISTIANSKKTTPVKVYLKGKLSELHFPKSVHAFIGKHTGTVIGDWAEIKPILKKAKLDDYFVETAGPTPGFHCWISRRLMRALNLAPLFVIRCSLATMR